MDLPWDEDEDEDDNDDYQNWKERLAPTKEWFHSRSFCAILVRYWHDTKNTNVRC